MNADQVVEEDGGASRQLDESQLQPHGCVAGSKRRARTPSTANNAEEDGMVVLRSFDGHQDDRTESKSSVEAMKKFSTNTIRNTLPPET